MTFPRIFFRRRKVAFQPIDPLGGGLAEEIAAEQAESERFVLHEQLDGSLGERWASILADVHGDSSATLANSDDN